MDSNEFISVLNSILPEGFEAKKYKRMQSVLFIYS